LPPAPATVLNIYVLLQTLAHSFADQPRERVGYTAGRKSNDKSDLSAWILLRTALVSPALKNEQRQRHRDRPAYAN
jgi:hypothetical protein